MIQMIVDNIYSFLYFGCEVFGIAVHGVGLTAIFTSETEFTLESPFRTGVVFCVMEDEIGSFIFVGTTE
jgi:hypothetical protein